jgi:uncharacterized protein YydD (DUF2326 family)
MIKVIKSTDDRFRPVEFTPGFNIVLAERTKESTKSDSCNGLGKSTLIEIVHFLLGAATRSVGSLLVPELDDWTFSMEVTFGKRTLEVSRSIKKSARVTVSGDIPDGFPKGVIGLDDWTSMLGGLAFGLDSEEEGSPSFRSLIAYFIRRGIGAYLDPFESFPKMRSNQRQLNNSFLLGLDWKIASAFDALNSRAAVITQMRREAKAGTLFGIERKLSELEIAKVRLERDLKRQATELDGFKVHPQYRELEEESSKLTTDIHQASNENFQDRQIISLYKGTLSEEHEASPALVEQMYKEAGLVFTDQLKQKLGDVLDFHKQVAKNRQTYLTQELERLNRAVRQREANIEKLTARRAELMQVLKTHGALDEYTLLQQRHIELRGQLDEMTRQIETLRKIELGKSSIDIDKAVLAQRAMTSLEEYTEQREQSISAFDNYVRQLYDRPGSLLIRIGKNGYEFDTKIDRKGSTGIDFMTVLCYDLTLSQLWAAREHQPGLLFHDSIIFDGVDPRQKARALELAAQESDRLGFQYICTLNADELPVSDFSTDFDYTNVVSHRLTDKNVAGSLLGLRIESKVRQSSEPDDDPLAGL